MIFEILIFIITTLVIYFVYSYKKIHNYFKQKNVKFAPGVPVFGNTFYSTISKKHLLDELQEVYNKYPDEKYVGFQDFTTPILLIRDPDLIKTITVKDFDHFTDHRDFLSPDCDFLFGGSLFLMKGEKWRGMRTTLSPAFTATKMKLMLPLILESANNIIEYLNDHQSQDTDVDDLARRYTSDIIASTAFGLKVNSVKDRDHEFYKIGSSIFDFNIKQKLAIVTLLLFPGLFKKLNIRIFSEETCNFFTNIVSSTMEYRKQEKVQRPDMIQLLMEARREWTPEELTGQVFLFFIAGFDTSATALAMAIHELALNPDVQDKLYQECREFQEEKELTFDSISELKYLDCVINETLRKWSLAIIMDRTCVKTYELPPPREGGQPCTVKPGDIVYNMVNVLHMDPKYFPEPEKFMPERFSDENKHNIKPNTYFPFGTGPRICLGLRFAMMELKVLMYHMMLNFSIVKCEKTQDPITLKPHSFSVKSLKGTWVKFEKRY